MSSLVFRITGDPGSFKAAMGEVSNSLDAAGRKAQSVSHQLASLGSTLSIGLTLPVVAAGTAFVKAAADMEKLNKGLASVMGSAAVGAAEMKKLQDAAKLPGLGLEGAVQGSIRLQVLGKTADQSRKIMAELGNAIALVGGGKDDFAEVTRQLGQMLSVGKVTKENLDTITERIPQISKIMIDTWGPQSVGDPAKFFEKAGISSRQFVDIIVGKLGEGARAGDTFANKLGNLEEAIKLASARIGDKMLPALEKLLPKLEELAVGAANAVDAFTNLPLQLQNTALALGSFLLAAGPVLSITSKIIDGFDKLKKAVGLAGIAVGALFGATVVASIAQTMTAIDQLNARYADLKKARDLVASGKADPVSGLTESGQELGKFKIDLKAIGDELELFGKKTAAVTPPVDDLGAAVGELTKKMPALAKVTAESEILMRLMAEATQKHATQLDKSADILRHYGTVSIDTALKLAKLEDAQFRLNRVLEDAPQITNGGIQFKDVPKFDGTITGGGDFEEFERMSKNIGEFGMQTKEQYDAMKQAAKGSANGQTDAMRQVSLVLTDLSRGITDVIFKGGKLGDMFKSVAMQAAQSITRLLIEGALAKLATKLLDIGGIMGTVFSGGTGVIKSAVPGVTAVGMEAGGLAGIPGLGGAGKTAGSIGGAVASAGVTAIVGAVAGVVNAVSGVIGNFQMAHMNTALGRIEESTRYMKIWTGEQSQSILWSVQTTAERLLYTNTSLDAIGRYASEMLGNLQQINKGGGMAGAGGAQFIVQGGNFVTDSAMQDLFEQFARFLKKQGM